MYYWEDKRIDEITVVVVLPTGEHIMAQVNPNEYSEVKRFPLGSTFYIGNHRFYYAYKSEESNKD